MNHIVAVKDSHIIHWHKGYAFNMSTGKGVEMTKSEFLGIAKKNNFSCFSIKNFAPGEYINKRTGKVEKLFGF